MANGRYQLKDFGFLNVMDHHFSCQRTPFRYPSPRRWQILLLNADTVVSALKRRGSTRCVHFRATADRHDQLRIKHPKCSSLDWVLQLMSLGTTMPSNRCHWWANHAAEILDPQASVLYIPNSVETRSPTKPNKIVEQAKQSNCCPQRVEQGDRFRMRNYFHKPQASMRLHAIDMQWPSLEFCGSTCG